MIFRFAPTVADMESLLLPPAELVREDMVPSVIVTTLVTISSLSSFLSVEIRSSCLNNSQKNIHIRSLKRSNINSYCYFAEWSTFHFSAEKLLILLRCAIGLQNSHHFVFHPLRSETSTSATSNTSVQVRVVVGSPYGKLNKTIESFND